MISRKVIYISIAILVIAFVCNCYKASALKTNVNIETYNEPQKEMIFFMASWCGHCKRFEPVWDKFVTKCMTEKIHPEIKLTKLDVDKDSEHKQGYRFKTHAVRGFPTIILTDINDKPGTPFNKSRTEDDLFSFLKENA